MADVQTPDNSATTQVDSHGTNTEPNASDNQHQNTNPPVVDENAAEPPKGDWSENWRETIAKQYAGEDRDAYEKEFKRLQRFQSPADTYKSMRELEKKLSSGQAKMALPDDATPEQIAEWRKENGIPETPDKYDLTLDNGLIVGEADMPMVNKFLEAMHAQNANPGQVKAALNTYFSLQEEVVQQRNEQDVDLADKCGVELRGEWGAEFKKNCMLRDNMLAEQFPDGIGEQLLYARLPDGTPVGSHPALLRGLVKIARELNPLGTTVPGGSESAMASAKSEMDAIAAKMGTTSYTEADRARYAELTEAMQSMERRA